MQHEVCCYHSTSHHKTLLPSKRNIILFLSNKFSDLVVKYDKECEILFEGVIVHTDYDNADEYGNADEYENDY